MCMVLNQNPKDRGRTDISDLNQDPIVVWQHKYYGGFILVFGMLFPMVVAGLGWVDWKGGLVYAGILRLLFLQQAPFCVNSLAHWLGDQVSHRDPYPLHSH
jgi:stearoyl-CoA desaturase (delta-9 desaturase)